MLAPKSRTLLIGCLMVGIALPVTAACESQSPHAETTPGLVAQAEPTAPGDSAAGVTRGANYTIQHAGVSLEAGAPGVLELRVTPGSGFKVNTEYPWLLTLDSGSAVTLERAEWDAASATALTDDEAVFTVPVTASEAGVHVVDGHLRFSVCNDYRCDTPQADVSWTVAVE